MINRIAYQYVKNKADAEDITQDVLLSLIKQTCFVNREHLKAWLIRVTINKSKDFLKSSKYRNTVALDKVMYSLTSEQAQTLDELDNLPENDRNILYLFYYEGYSVKEIAGILDKKEPAIFKHLSRAREKLKAYLEDI